MSPRHCDPIDIPATLGIAFVMLDWGRDLMSVVATSAPRAARLLMRQCAVGPLQIAHAIIAALASACNRCADNRRTFDDGSSRGLGSLDLTPCANPMA
jgi:hypothetical protein